MELIIYFCSPWPSCSPLSMLLPMSKLLSLGMLFPSGNAAVPWASCATCGRSPVRPIYFEAGSSCSSSIQLSKKVTVLGGKISSQTGIERLLISSPPSKRTLIQKKANFFVHFFYSRFQMNFSWEQLASKLPSCWWFLGDYFKLSKLISSQKVTKHRSLKKTLYNSFFA